MNEILAAEIGALTTELLKHSPPILMAEKKNKARQLNIRLDDDTKERFAAACALTKEDESAVVRVCIEAFIETVERDGEITKPYALVAKKRLLKLETDSGFSVLKAAEDSPPQGYGGKNKKAS